MIKINKRFLIQSTKDVLGGEPVFRGTRVPVKALIDYLQSGDRLDDFLSDYPTVKKQQALDVLELLKRNISKS